MALITWDEQRYSVQVAELDTHHRTLIGYINELNEAMKEGKGREKSPELVKQLVDYTRYHFSREEELLQTTRYPDLAVHQKEHQAFIAKVTDMVRDLQQGKTAIAVTLLNFLHDWLLKHITGTDRKYSAHLLANGVK